MTRVILCPDLKPIERIDPAGKLGQLVVVEVAGVVAQVHVGDGELGGRQGFDRLRDALGKRAGRSGGAVDGQAASTGRFPREITVRDLSGRCFCSVLPAALRHESELQLHLCRRYRNRVLRSPLS